jgi:hypothetical protein
MTRPKIDEMGKVIKMTEEQKKEFREMAKRKNRRLKETR